MYQEEGGQCTSGFEPKTMSQIAVERQTEGNPEACLGRYSTASNTHPLKEELAVPRSSSLIANTTHTKLHHQSSSKSSKISSHR